MNEIDGNISSCLAFASHLFTVSQSSNVFEYRRGGPNLSDVPGILGIKKNARGRILKRTNRFRNELICTFMAVLIKIPFTILKEQW